MTGGKRAALFRRGPISWLAGFSVLLWAVGASALPDQVPITPGSIFEAGLVEYEILANVGFGDTAEVQPALNGFDFEPVLSAFAFLNDNAVEGHFTFRAEGIEIGELVAVIDAFRLIFSGEVTATGGGAVDINAQIDVVDSTDPDDLLLAPVTKPELFVLGPGDTWEYDETWDIDEFGLSGIPLAMVADIDIILAAAGIGSTNFGEGMVISEAHLVPGSSIPEPSTALLVGGSLALLASWRRRRRMS